MPKDFRPETATMGFTVPAAALLTMATVYEQVAPPRPQRTANELLPFLLEPARSGRGRRVSHTTSQGASHGCLVATCRGLTLAAHRPGAPSGTDHKHAMKVTVQAHEAPQPPGTSTKLQHHKHPAAWSPVLLGIRRAALVMLENLPPSEMVTLRFNVEDRSPPPREGDIDWRPLWGMRSAVALTFEGFAFPAGVVRPADSRPMATPYVSLTTQWRSTLLARGSYGNPHQCGLMNADLLGRMALAAWRHGNAVLSYAAAPGRQNDKALVPSTMITFRPTTPQLYGLHGYVMGRRNTSQGLTWDGQP
ncbi:hypothetical protein E3E12_04185 [Formicincola oecophyllae]|uniref:Uncharacterized protein n=1 Tax=Formicincola oecophyllae TaxID=2558361 RepID=A0A4Y6UBM9_9PROT|nr:hypothetical protein [Formicincola oecophyllae]QDH13525.1 hypothetical protein E3E12_04185 [Formicincola oecophyllae]